MKVHATEHGKATEHVTGAADGTGAPAGSGAAAGGRAYLSRASARRRDRRDAHGRARAEADAVDTELRRYSVAATRHRPQSERLTGRRDPQLLNAAYLVEDAEGTAFQRALARLAAEGRHPAVEISASGPWIPYSFARWDDRQDATEPARTAPAATEPARTAPAATERHPTKQEVRP